MSGRDRTKALHFGLQAETVAALMLQMKLYTILDRRYRIREGEVDIIARRGATIAFIEVKARPTLDAAAIAITAEKTRRISRAARHWVATHPWAARCILRGDAIFVAPRKLPLHVIAAVELDLG
jgi:putative endonuclease